MRGFGVPESLRGCTHGLERVDSLNRTSRKLKRVVFISELHYARLGP